MNSEKEGVEQQNYRTKQGKTIFWFFSVLLGPIYPIINQYQDALDKYILKRTTETKKISQFTAVLVHYYFNNIKKIPMDCQLEGRRFQHKLAGTLPGQELQYQAAILERVLASERLCWSSKSFSSLDFPVTRAGAPAEAPLKHTLAACLPAGSFRFLQPEVSKHRCA